MQTIFKKWVSLFAVGISLSVGATAWAAAPNVVVTSSGQALDAFTVKTMLSRAGVENTYDAVIEADALDGTDVLIVAVGASVKGFGAAGITADSEKARTQALLDKAKEEEAQVIAVHIGGSDRRGGLSEQFVTLVSEQADILVVSEEGNSDDYFTRVSQERDVPLVLIKLPAQVGGAIAELIAD